MQTKDNANFFIVAAKGWVQKQNKFLLARRGPEELHMPGVWSLPGGKVENEIMDNILEKTVAKEIEEEVGIIIDSDMKIIHNNSFQRSDGATVIGLTYLCQYQSGAEAPLEDTTEIAWYTLEELEVMENIESFLKKEIKILSSFLKKEDTTSEVG